MIENINKSDIVVLAKTLSIDEIQSIKTLQDLARKTLRASEYISQNISFNIGETIKTFSVHIDNSILESGKNIITVCIDNIGQTTVTLPDGRIITFNFCSPNTIYPQLTPLIDKNNIDYVKAKIIENVLDWAIDTYSKEHHF